MIRVASITGLQGRMAHMKFVINGSWYLGISRRWIWISEIVNGRECGVDPLICPWH